METQERKTGSVSVYIKGRRFGFINGDDEIRYFMHESRINKGQEVFVSARVSFTVSPLREGSCPTAMGIEVIPEAVQS